MESPRRSSPRWLGASLVALLLLAGCAAGTPGQDDITYYYQGKQGGPGQAPAAPAVAPVVASNPEPAASGGPVGVARIVYFDFDKHDVKREYLNVIQAHADHLRARPHARVVLEGHTDSRGGREYNLALGQRRADAVARLIGLAGVRPNQIETVSWGMEKPAAPGDSEAGHQLNRRVEFLYR